MRRGADRALPCFAALFDEVRRVSPLWELGHLHVHPERERCGSRAASSSDARAVRVERDDQVIREALEELALRLGECRPRERNGVGEARLMRED